MMAGLWHHHHHQLLVCMPLGVAPSLLRLRPNEQDIAIIFIIVFLIILIILSSSIIIFFNNRINVMTYDDVAFGKKKNVVLATLGLCYARH